MRNYQRMFNCLCLVVLLTGCARDNMEFSPEFLSKPSAVAIAQVSGLEKPCFYKEGGQGLLDIVVNEMVTGSVGQKVSEIDATPIVAEHYNQPFEKSLAAKSYKVTKVSAVLDKGKLQSGPVPEGQYNDKYSPYDLRFLARQYKVDYALMLEPGAFGTVRPYYGFIPLGAPKGYSDVKIYLVKLSDNSIQGYYNAQINVSVGEAWDTPPHYSALLRASKTSLINALNNAHAYFFRDGAVS